MPNRTEPSDFIIIIDTREQQPYTFPCDSVRHKLYAGDYSVLGHETEVAVERKSLADFQSTVAHAQARFQVELDKLLKFKAAAVVIEADLTQLLLNRYKTRLSPKSILGWSTWIQIVYGVPVIWAGSRQGAVAWTEEFLRGYVRWAQARARVAANTQGDET